MERNFTNIKERIVYFIEYKGDKKENIFSNMGMTSANFRGKNLFCALNSDAIERFLTIYPDVSADWLITGKGNMIRENQYIKLDRIDCACEPETEYGKVQSEKDKRIEELKDQIAILKEHVKLLKEISAK